MTALAPLLNSTPTLSSQTQAAAHLPDVTMAEVAPLTTSSYRLESPIAEPAERSRRTAGNQTRRARCCWKRPVTSRRAQFIKWEHLTSR
jgi:hypothetical protein